MIGMKIFDISQELFSCVVFPGDPAPDRQILNSIEAGDLYNLTALSMCAHNGTHIDAPSHFIKNGKTIDELDLSKLIGEAYVADFTGNVTAEDAKSILAKAREISPESARRILLKGKTTVTLEAAEVFAESGVWLVGNESQTVGPEDAPLQVHLTLLGAEVVLLEGIRLSQVPEGVYILNAAPINLGAAEGAPCRAVLIKQHF